MLATDAARHLDDAARDAVLWLRRVSTTVTQSTYTYRCDDVALKPKDLAALEHKPPGGTVMQPPCTVSANPGTPSPPCLDILSCGVGLMCRRHNTTTRQRAACIAFAACVALRTLLHKPPRALCAVPKLDLAFIRLLVAKQPCQIHQVSTVVQPTCRNQLCCLAMQCCVRGRGGCLALCWVTRRAQVFTPQQTSCHYRLQHVPTWCRCCIQHPITSIA